MENCFRKAHHGILELEQIVTARPLACLYCIVKKSGTRKPNSVICAQRINQSVTPRIIIAPTFGLCCK